MKMLKRAGAIAIAGAMALTLGSVAYAADPTITVGDIKIGDVVDGIATVTVPYTTANLAEGAQVTLLAELGAKEGVYAESIVYETTAYIDQDAAGSEFTFKINESRLVGDKDADVWLNVKVGGTGVATAAEGSVQAYEYVEAVADPITSTDVKGALEVDSDSNVVTWTVGDVNAGIMRLDATDLIATTDAEGNTITPKLDLATQVVTIDGVEARYTVYNGVTKLVSLVDSSKETHEIAIAAKDGGSTELIYGDSNGDISLDAADLSSTIKKILGSATLSSLSDYNHFAADANGDISVDAADLSVAIKDILNETYIPGAAK